MNGVVRKTVQQAVTKLRSGLGISRDAGRIVVRGSGDQPGSEQPQQNIRALYGGLSGSALVEFMAPVQLKPYELQYFYASWLRHLAFERGWVSPLKKMTKCG
ncbi:MAG TPA: hypothetical protein VNZ53_12450, partial [Steroidobacteraceae bacterium]|nr:hypothetical protein [Steroidobacteraceae bacterium]